jgi:hypothetical protein
MTEQRTETRRMAATLTGLGQPAPVVAGSLTEEMRSLLACYREGLNSNSPLYQALSFYKVMEGVEALTKRRSRAAARAGASSAADPMAERLPSDLSELIETSEWSREVFAPYLRKTFSEVEELVRDAIRNAVAHLTPGKNVLVSDRFVDIDSCRLIAPVLRYVARRLISGELTVPLVPSPAAPVTTVNPANGASLSSS